MRLRVIDLETTGDAPPGHGVCEAGWCDVRSTTNDLLSEPAGWVVDIAQSRLVNPTRPIPPETSAVHHIVDEDIEFMAAPWPEQARAVFEREMRSIPRDEPIAALVAHSAKFERLFCTDELTGGLPWICTYKAALRLWPDAPSHSNQALRYWRKPSGLVRALAMPAHRAGPDAYVTAHHLRDMLNAGATVKQLIEWSSQPALQVKCHIGKFRGQLWSEVEIGFLYWLLGKDFDEDVMFTARHWIDRHEKEQREALTREDASS